MENGIRNPVADTENQEFTKFTSIPYVNGLSETIQRLLSKHDIKCAFYSNNTLRKFLSEPKDKVPIEKQNNIIYKIPCRDCSAVYIRESKRSHK